MTMADIIVPEKKLIKPGWYRDIPNEEYHGSNGTSSSGLKTFMEKTGAHYDYDRAHHENKETDTMALGTAFHSLTLEPDKFQDDIIVRPASIKQRRGKDWEAFKLDAGKRTIITVDQHEAAKHMSNNVREDKYAGALVRDIIVESSVYWWYKSPDRYDGDDTHYKELLKVRPDAASLAHSALIDLKSCVSGNFTQFMKAITRYYYHLSGSMYLEGANQCEELLKATGHFAFNDFIFLCCENEPPYEVSIYRLSEKDRFRGTGLYHTAVRKLHEAREYSKENSEWPGYFEGVRDTELPPWAERGDHV